MSSSAFVGERDAILRSGRGSFAHLPERLPDGWQVILSLAWRPPIHRRPPAPPPRLLQAYELLFWDTLADAF